jgi:hypothetical protein
MTKLKMISLEGMLALINTVQCIDENSKKMAYKPFLSQNVNQLGMLSPLMQE